MKNETVYRAMREMVAAVEEGNNARYMVITRDHKHALDGCEAGCYVRRALDEYLTFTSSELDGVPYRLLRIKAAVHNMWNSRNLFDRHERPKEHPAPLSR